MLVIEFNGGNFNGLKLELAKDLDDELIIDLVRSAMFFHVNKDPPEIIEARKLLKHLEDNNVRGDRHA